MYSNQSAPNQEGEEHLIKSQSGRGVKPDRDSSGGLEEPACDPRSRAKTHFGWVFFPRSNPDDGLSGESHVPDNVLVSALVSVPSWWGYLRLKVETCWMDADDLHTIAGVDDLCADRGRRAFQSHDLFLKIPGTAKEVLSRLTFFPLKAPYLALQQGESNVVQVGRPGTVTLAGERLWKNPKVKLGQQWADSVEVLPDMRGIIAHFKCVLPDSSRAISERSRGDFRLPSERSIAVWTSEGRTSNDKVRVWDFADRGTRWGKEDLPCWLKEEERP
ncbi:MAG: hypothetical protein AAFY02_02600 [Pseudomonadota bacterium]